MADPRAVLSGPALQFTSLDVFDAFLACARLHAEHVAIAEPTRQIHYGDLVRLVEMFRCEFRGLRSAPGSARVALRAEPSIPYIAAVLALFAERVSYVPLPLDQPATRQAMMHDLAAPTATLDAWDLEATFERFLDGSQQPTNVEPRPREEADHEAYVLFTSGSTGVPKGVRGSARALATRLGWMTSYHALGPGDALLAKASTGFDVSLVELVGPLLSGARIEIVDRAALRRPDHLLTTLIERAITAVVLLPAQLEQLLVEMKERKPRLRHVFTGGEAFGIDLVRRFSAAFPHATLTNGYGPTEGTISVTAWRATSLAEQVELGTPLPGVQLVVVGDDGRAVERAGCGELWIGGDCLALGYLEQSEAAPHEAFGRATAHYGGTPFYRTGDRVERNGDRLTFVGRIDRQVKVAGVRVEIGDIEALVRAHPGVGEVAVEVDGAGGLVAYFTASANESTLRGHLGARLPDALVPRLVQLSAFPLDPNGKIDRRALQKHTLEPATAATSNGSTSIARARQLWSEVLGHEQFDDDTDYFAAGGTSRNVLRLLRTWERSLGRTLELGRLYEATTPRAQAEFLERSAATAHAHEDAGTFPFLYLLAHARETPLPAILERVLGRLVQADVMVEQRPAGEFVRAASSTYVRAPRSRVRATLHAGECASLLSIELPADVALAVERPDDTFDPLGLDALFVEHAPHVRVAPLRDPALWERKRARSRDVAPAVLARTTDAAYRAQARASWRARANLPSVQPVPFHGLERFHSQCLLGGIEAICRTLFGHRAHDAVLGERTIVVDVSDGLVTVGHETPDFSLLRKRLRSTHGVEFRRVPVSGDVLGSFVKHLQSGMPLLVDFDFAHLAHRPEYDAPPSYHPVVLVGVDAARHCFLAQEQTSGLVPLPFAECEAYFAGTLPNGERPGTIECEVVDSERTVDARDVATRLDRSLTNLLSTGDALGLGALERAVGEARRTAGQANWQGTWILSHDLFGLERLLARAQTDLGLDLCSKSELARISELRQAWHQVDTLLEHARLTGERRLVSLALERAPRLINQERQLATRLGRARDRLLEHRAP